MNLFFFFLKLQVILSLCESSFVLISQWSIIGLSLCISVTRRPGHSDLAQAIANVDPLLIKYCIDLKLWVKGGEKMIVKHEFHWESRINKFSVILWLPSSFLPFLFHNRKWNKTQEHYMTLIFFGRVLYDFDFDFDIIQITL